MKSRDLLESSPALYFRRRGLIRMRSQHQVDLGHEHREIGSPFARELAERVGVPGKSQRSDHIGQRLKKQGTLCLVAPCLDDAASGRSHDIRYLGRQTSLTYTSLAHDQREGRGRARGPLPARNLSLIHISEPTRLRRISYAVFCLKKKK